jgi:hypothetical protein
MPIVDTVWHCSRCSAEFPTAGEAEDCEKRDEWGLKLEDHAARMYEVLNQIADSTADEALFTVRHKAAVLIADLGPPPPPRKD